MTSCCSVCEHLCCSEAMRVIYTHVIVMNHSQFTVRVVSGNTLLNETQEVGQVFFCLGISFFSLLLPLFFWVIVKRRQEMRGERRDDEQQMVLTALREVYLYDFIISFLINSLRGEKIARLETMLKTSVNASVRSTLPPLFLFLPVFETL